MKNTSSPKTKLKTTRYTQKPFERGGGGFSCPPLNLLIAPQREILNQFKNESSEDFMGD